MTWVEKRKLRLSLLALAPLLALPIVWIIVWIRKPAAPIQTETPRLSLTDNAKAEVEGAFQDSSGEGFRASVVEKTIELPELHYTRLLTGGYKLSVSLNISSAEELERGAYWCGAPFLFSYEGGANARILNEFGSVEDEISLTSPALVIGKPPNYDYYYYKTYDLDGDGNSSEFLILDYASCNSNWVKMVKADVKTHKFIELPFLIDGGEKYKILTGPNKDDLTFSRGRITTKTYDMVSGLFHKRVFAYKDDMFIETSQF